jgi:outer membrane protein assembly factor BamB
MRIDSHAGTIEVIDEPAYSFGSADNTRNYRFAKNLAPRDRPSSVHGLLLNGEPLAVFANGGGASSVHEHSSVYVNGSLYVAVGDSVVCLNLSPFDYKWSVQVDSATCFGIYYDERHRALISHGELEIARISEDGRLLWSVSGADIFSEKFSLLPQFVEVLDFNGQTYRFQYERGLPHA